MKANPRRNHNIALAMLIAVIASIATGAAWANDGPPSLRQAIANGDIELNDPDDLRYFVRNKHAAIVLGKALFWDMQVGSDGVTACASCHFHAGADNRVKNQLNPGSPHLPPPYSTTFNTAGTDGPNYTLKETDFPFHVRANPADRDSKILYDNDDVVGSQGVIRVDFHYVIPGSPVDSGTLVPDPVFNVGGINVRQTTSRNSPTPINAVFNEVQFWDGRAVKDFNGVSPIGSDEPHAIVYRANRKGRIFPEEVSIGNASLASQAVGPPLSAIEMSFLGRTWPDIGKKMFSLPPLALQIVATDDSVLGPYAAAGTGLTVSYEKLVKMAFHPRWWRSHRLVSVNGEDYTQAEANFSLIFGLAVQLYEATLISDDTPYDRFQEGDLSALTFQQQMGLDVFVNKGNCSGCHDGALFTNNGFSGAGVRRIDEDMGMSSAQFKTPGLRNVELTGPYFHSGGHATLEDVIEVYDRGGNFEDSTDLSPIGFTVSEEEALVAFLKSLTDERVRYEREPFDHPQLFVPAGHAGDDNAVTNDGTGGALSDFVEIPATGAAGGSPLRPFLE